MERNLTTDERGGAIVGLIESSAGYWSQKAFRNNSKILQCKNSEQEIQILNKWRKLVAVCFLAATVPFALTGCISTQEMPLAPNVVRIDTQSRGLLFTGQTVPQTMRAAAKATLDRGYTHFRFEDAAMNQGAVVAGVVGSSQTNFNGNSSTSYNGTYGRGYVNGNADTSISGTANTFGSSTVVRAPTASAAATVIMYHANEPGAQGAFDAVEVQKQYSQ